MTTKFERDCERAQTYLADTIAATRSGLAGIRHHHRTTPSDGVQMFNDMADFTGEQLNRIEFAQKTWVSPHSLKVKSKDLAPIVQAVADARKTIIDIALAT